MLQDFRVIDTEGFPVLREVALFDSRGTLIFEARVPQEEDTYYAADLARPLPDLLRELRSHLQDHALVAHNASHDRAVLEASFGTCGLNAPELSWICTYELAQQLHPDLESYALGALCDHLSVGGEPFSRDEAHLAAYDARYTYLLYRQLQRHEHSRRLSEAGNPFNSSRVDSPFQKFADDLAVHQAAFQQLSAVLRSVAGDPNRQSQGAVLIGEPGSGKTHLVMRLANEVLQNNRLLFVRQPTTAEDVLFHIYSRTLESLVERVGEGAHSQLDLLLIRGIRRIVAGEEITGPWREIVPALEAEDLDRLGKDGSDVKRQRWEKIEVRLLRWWGEQQGGAGYGRQILQGLLRFCRYSDPRLRESCRRWLATGEHEQAAQELEGLSAWNEPQLREEFSLQALRVIGMLCSLDQPLILVFDQLEGMWLEGNRPVLLRFGQVVKELFTHMPNALILLTLFPDRWQAFQREFDGSVTDRIGQHQIHLEKPRTDQIEEILDLRLEPLNTTARTLFSSEELSIITRQPSLRRCLNRAGSFYEHLVRGVPLPRDSAGPIAIQSPESEAASLHKRVLELEQQYQSLSQKLARLQATGRPPEIVEVNQPNGNTFEPSSIPTPGDAVAVPAEQEISEVEADFLRYREISIATLRERWRQPQIVNGSDDAGKLRQICMAHEKILPLKVDTLKLGNKMVPDNVVIRIQDRSWCVAFLHVDNANSITARLGNLNQLVSRQRQIHFILMRDQFSTTIRSPGAMAAMAAFRNGSGDGAKRTHCRSLDHQRRVDMEFAFQLVTDVLNREVDFSLGDGLNLLMRHEPENWVLKLLRST